MTAKRTYPQRHIAWAGQGTDQAGGADDGARHEPSVLAERQRELAGRQSVLLRHLHVLLQQVSIQAAFTSHRTSSSLSLSLPQALDSVGTHAVGGSSVPARPRTRGAMHYVPTKAIDPLGACEGDALGASDMTLAPEAE